MLLNTTENNIWQLAEHYIWQKISIMFWKRSALCLGKDQHYILQKISIMFGKGLNITFGKRLTNFMFGNVLNTACGTRDGISLGNSLRNTFVNKVNITVITP